MSPKQELIQALETDNIQASVDFLMQNGGDEWLSELQALKTLSEDEIGAQHKNNYLHTLKVVDQCGADASLECKMAGLLHDIGKPACRQERDGKITFHNHEQVSIRLAKIRMIVLGFDSKFIKTVCGIIRGAGQIQNYQTNWSDSAVRRVKRENVLWWDDSLRLAKADCTTRHDWKRKELWDSIDVLVERIEKIEQQDWYNQQRPVLDGRALQNLGVSPGPEMGALLKRLLKENRAGRLKDKQEATSAVLSWVEEQGSPL